jgi:hypothetical protein
MFDLLDTLLAGTRFEAHGKKWVYLKGVKDDAVLAVEEEATIPAPVYLVQRPKEQKSETEQGQESPAPEKGAV